MERLITDTEKPIKIWASDLEGEAERQLRNLASLPIIYSHVAAMADSHAGRGSTVGAVIATRGAIIPAAVGVDIGCGMCAVRTPFKVDQLGGSEKWRRLRGAIERAVPTGHDVNRSTSERTRAAFASLGPLSPTAQASLRKETMEKASLSLGSLGGGNHFIELCTDLEENLWVMLHSGSRNIGKTLADIHISKAKHLMKETLYTLPDPDLAYLTQDTRDFRAYMHDLLWAQQFAKENRNEMMIRMLREVSMHVLSEDIGVSAMTHERVDCHHNYTALENYGGHQVYITRKGAVSARKNELGIIPGSMGAKSFIVRGLGNLDSFCSCSHGAGRRMSRTKAKELFSEADLRRQTEGVECRKDRKVVDEIPAAYKDIDQVMLNQRDLVEPVHQLKQLICVKGA